MSAILLDTTVLIDYLRGRHGTRRRLAELWSRGDDAYVCAVSIEEVTRGIRRGEDEELLTLLGGLIEAPLGVPEGRLAGWWRRTLAKRGRTLSQSDALIAAAAVGVRARIATGNAGDFRLPAVTVEHWPVGE
ncbi:MAG TPA: type II toxin-antitoxin system VapC family toxin [Actinomycetota bacterium]